jgi:uncharacterized membrane-anchored protein
LVNQDSNLTFHNFWQIVDDVLGAILWAWGSATRRLAVIDIGSDKDISYSWALVAYKAGTATGDYCKQMNSDLLNMDQWVSHM